MPALLAACFAISGATSLVLQVVWVRKLIELFGSSTLAISTVLATFMGGLAVGAWAGGKLADRARRDPLLYYGVAEATVGLSALAILPLIDGLRPSNAWLWSHLSDTPALLSVARVALAAVVLGVPTIMMGATLPLLSRRVIRDDLGALGRRVGILYAANTGGAVVGAGTAGFWAIPALGVTSTNLLAAVTAIALGAAVILVALRRNTNASAEPDPNAAPAADADADDRRETQTSPRHRRLALAAYGLSGLIAMALEVFYSRSLAIVIGSSIHSFTLVLVVFLVGIAVGAAALAPLAARTSRPLALLGWLLAGVSASVAIAHAAIDDLPDAFLALLDGTSLDIGSILWAHTVLTGLVIFPAAFCLGAVMPVAIRAYVGSLDAVGRDVGRAYAANTVGAIAGALIAGFVALPVLGLDVAIRVAIALDAAAAVALIALAGRRRAWAIAPAALLALAIALPAWNKSDFTAGLFRTHLARTFIEAGGLRERDVVFYEDGVSTTVSVERLSDDRWVLKNNGKVEASNRHDMPTQVLVGLLPVLLHPGDRQDVFVIGYGSGVTVGSIAQAPQVASVDVVELEPAVLVAADRYFSRFNHSPQTDPKVTRFIGDGRNVLLAGGERYDIIVSEPSNPWIAGVASLFSRDFYEFAKAHLAPGGLYCQWAQLYELGPRNVKMIYRTFHESFPYVYAFAPSDESTDTILVGSLEPIRIDVGQLASRMAASRALSDELARAFVDRPETILAGMLLAPSDLPAFTAGADVNTDDHPQLEYYAPRDLLASSSGNKFADMIRGEHWPYGALTGELGGLGDGAARASRELALSTALLGFGRLRAAAAWLAGARAAATAGSELERAEQLFGLCDARDLLDPEIAITAGGPPLSRPSPDAFTGARERAAEAAGAVERALSSVSVGDWLPAQRALSRLPPTAATDAGRDVALLAGYVAYKSLQLERAQRWLEPLVEDAAYRRRRPAARYYLGRSLYAMGRFREGVAHLDAFRRDDPALAREAIATRVARPGDRPEP